MTVDQSLPTVSVIVRTTGHDRLPRAIDAARGQTWPNIEIVLVVANPTFDAQAWAGDPRIVLVAPGQPLDRPRAANAGLDKATGDWLSFLDEDDWIDAEHVETLWRAVTNAPNLLLAYSDMMIHKDGQPFVRSLGYWKQTFTDQPFFSMHPPLFSRRLRELGCRFDEQFTLLEDWDFFIQCAEYTDFLHVPVASAHYDPHSGSSGGGIGVNRNEERMRPYVDRLTAKWGKHYAGITARATEALRQADEAISKQDFVVARQVLMMGLNADPGNPLLLNRLAACDRQAGDLSGMVKALRRACDSDRKAFRMHLELAALEQRLGFPDRARELAARLATIAKTDEERGRVTGLEEYLNRGASARLG
jgi:glycosyltransferase involved in cell wall biosynthesis